MQVFDEDKKRICTLFGFKERKIVKTLSSGDEEMIFQYPTNGIFQSALKLENYIRTKEQEYVLKKAKPNGEWTEYTAVLNVEELENYLFPYGFESVTQKIDVCLEFAFEGTGWKIGKCEVTKKRTINFDDRCNPWNILQSCLETYACECKIHTLTKTIDIYEKVGEDKGAYFIEGLNLKELSLTNDTYDFYTSIMPVGADNITIGWKYGSDYINNFEYSKKKKIYVWVDKRYTSTDELYEDGERKLKELSKPYKAYTAKIIDLANQSEKYKGILDYEIGDTVMLISKSTGIREKQRIVKLTDYPENRKKNTAELSNASKTYAQIQTEETDKAKEEAATAAGNRLKKILKDGYWTKEEIETEISAAADKIKLEVSRTYVQTSTYEEGIAGAAKDATQKANAAKEGAIADTTNRLKNYSTTEEMNSAIKIATDSITLDVSRTYVQTSTYEEGIEGAAKDATQKANAAKEGAIADTTNRLKSYSTTEEMKAAIKIEADKIELKTSAKDVESIIEQRADHIRIRAEKIAWSSTYSSMTEDGELTCQRATILGNFETEQIYNGNYKKTTLKEGVLRGYYDGALYGLLDMSAIYSDGERHVALKGYDYLHLQAGKKILAEAQIEAGNIIADSVKAKNGISGTFEERKLISLTFTNGILTGVSESIEVE